MESLLCPTCSKGLEVCPGEAVCISGHKFPFIKDIIDLLPQTSDNNIISEQEHWDNVADRGGNVIVPNEYINKKIIDDLRRIYKQVIIQHWPAYRENKITIGELGCSYGSATNYLKNIEFSSVNYIGADVSLKRLQLGKSKGGPPNWKKKYVRASANTRTFGPNSVDIMFCVGALHHLDLYKVFEWVPSSITYGGLLLLHEPSSHNPVAKVARKMVEGFHTKGEKPLIPSHVKEVAESKGLRLVYTRGLHFLNGSLQYLWGKFKVPRPIPVGSYHLANCVDRLITSPSLSYSFVQIYEKV
jgi:SAM-dependent methyltransferase